MVMATLKTSKNKSSVRSFIAGIENDQRKKDCKQVVEIMKEITGEKPAMWGDSIIGFGEHEYTNTQGTASWMRVGVSPRKQSLTVYIMTGFEPHEKLMAKLGKYKTGRSCLYIKKMEDVDEKVLRKLIKSSYENIGKL